MVADTRVLRMFLAAVMWIIAFQHVRGALTKDPLRKIALANRQGPYIRLIVPNALELNPLLHSPYFTSTEASIDLAGKRFRFGAIWDQPVIVVMTGLSMVNAAVTTQLLLNIFQVKGVLHYGTAGNLNTYLNTGDVMIPQCWAHLALWNWQRNGQGPEDELPLEANGDYTSKIGYLKFADYTTNVRDGRSYDNLLKNIRYQPEEIFPIDGTPEERQHAFRVPVDSMFLQMYQKLEKAKGCESPKRRKRRHIPVKCSL